MSMKCAVCGLENNNVMGLCTPCFIKENFHVRMPDYIDVEVCGGCKDLKYGNTWLKPESTDETVIRAAKKNLSIDSPEPYEFIIDYFQEDEYNYHVIVTASIVRDENSFESTAESKLRMKKSVCNVCSRISGNYFESILQLRRSKTGISQEEKERVELIFHTLSSKDNSSMSFITKIEETSNGFDYYLGSVSMARNAARKIQDIFGGEVIESNEHAGRKDGRNMFRVIFCVRLPSFSVKDFIIFEKDVYLIRSVSTGKVKLAALKNGRERSVKYALSSSFNVLGGKNVLSKAIVVTQSPSEAQVLEVNTNALITVLKPFEINYPEDVLILKTQIGNYVVNGIYF